MNKTINKDYSITKMIIFSVTVLGFIATGIWALVDGIYTNKLEALKLDYKECKSNWGKIQPLLDNEYTFNLKKILISAHQKQLPKDSELIDDNILANTKIKGLNFYKSSIVKYVCETNPQQCKYDCLDIFFDETPLYVWKADKGIEIYKQGEKETHYPEITIYKLLKKRVRNQFIEFLNCSLEESISIKVNGEEEQIKKKMLDSAAQIDKSEMTSKIYSLKNTLVLLEALFNPNYNFKAIMVQKENNILQAHHLHTYRGNFEGETNAGQYFTKEHLIVFETHDLLYIIKIQNQSKNIVTNPEFDKLVNQWVSGLRIFHDI